MRNAIVIALAARVKAAADEAAKCARLARLVALREEAFPLAFAAQRRGHLILRADGYFADKDDGRRSILHWWTETYTAKKDGWQIFRGIWSGHAGAPSWRRHTPDDSCTHYFGMSRHDTLSVFANAGGNMEPYRGHLVERAAYLDFLIAEGIGGRLARAIVVAWARLRSRRRLRRLHKDGRISCGKPSSLFSR